MMSKRNWPTVEDELWLEGLSIDVRARLSRVFFEGVRVRESLEEAYSRGYSQGFNGGKCEMLKEIKRCEVCKYRVCKEHGNSEI